MRGRSLILAVLISFGFCRMAAAQICPARPDVGTAISNPLDLYSQNGTLTLNLALKSEIGPTGFTHYCYVYMNNGVPVEAPTLRLNPGDQLVINFLNNITATGKAPKSRHAQMRPMEMGDAHAAMGHGELSAAGLEMARENSWERIVAAMERHIAKALSHGRAVAAPVVETLADSQVVAQLQA